MLEPKPSAVTMSVFALEHELTGLLTLGLHWMRYRSVKSSSIKTHLKDGSIFFNVRCAPESVPLIIVKDPALT